MYEILKGIADSNQWGFDYGRSDYLNLVNDIESDKIYLFVDPIQTETQFTDSGSERITYAGKLMLLISSSMQENYIEKYENLIKPIISDSLQIIKDSIVCQEFNINKFSSVEVINLFDVNLDGILITYSLTEPM